MHQRKGNATEWPDENNEYVFVAPDSGGGYYNFLGFLPRVQPFLEALILREPLSVGYKTIDFTDHKGRRIEVPGYQHTFIPGEQYAAFGSNSRTSAGFIWYRGAPLTFEGTYDGHALFTEGGEPFIIPASGYETEGKLRGDEPESRGDLVCFWTWKYNAEHFIGITSVCTPRIMTFESEWDGLID